MSKEWKEVKFRDLVENKSRKFDFNNKSKVVFVNTSDVLEGKFLQKDYVSKEGLPGQAKKKIIKGDILFSEIRPANKRYALVDFDAEDFVVSTKFMVLNRVSNEVDLNFLYILITSNITLKRLQLIAESRSGTFPQITFKVISHLSFNLPPLQEQKAIAHVLGTLDDKIELNRKMNETLEAMAQAMFKSWFIDFDPVLDNALAQGNTIPDALQAKAERRKAVLASGKYKALPAAIQGLFPASFVYNEELGKWIPNGWEGASLQKIADISTGFPFKSKHYGQGEGIKVVRGENVSLGYLRWNTLKTWEGEVEKLDKYWLEERDIVIGMDGSRIGRNRAFVPKYELPMLLAQRVACVRPKKDFGASFVGQMVFSDYFEKYIELVKTGTSIPHMSLKQIKEFPIVIPNNNLAFKYSLLTDSLLEKIFSNNHRNKDLSKTRDLLLSQLISGKTRLPESFVQQF